MAVSNVPRHVATSLVALAVLLSACQSEDPPSIPPSETGAAAVVECLQGNLRSLRFAAQAAENGLDNAFPEIRRVFRAALRGERRVTAGTERRLPIRGVFAAAATTLRDDHRLLRRALDGARGCGAGRPTP